jgi:nicotinamidase-related amidase
MYTYSLKRRKLAITDGCRRWEETEEKAEYKPEETALVIVDMWDQHWSAGATRRCGALAETIDEAARRARGKGILVVNAPSSTMDFYEGAEARKRFLSIPKPDCIPEPVSVEEYPQPVDSSDGGSDTVDDYPPNTRVWKRQTGKIFIDQERDLICGDEGDQLCAHLEARGIKFIIYLGVHTHMCILNRSFAIKKMIRRGYKTALVRDLTDAMYNPAMPPYVNHEEGTALIIEYIEKFYSPTIDSAQI